MAIENVYKALVFCKPLAGSVLRGIVVNAYRESPRVSIIFAFGSVTGDGLGLGVLKLKAVRSE